MYSNRFNTSQYGLDCMCNDFMFNARIVTDRELKGSFIQGGIASIGQALTIATLDSRVSVLKPLTAVMVEGVTYKLSKVTPNTQENIGRSYLKKDKKQIEYVIALE